MVSKCHTQHIFRAVTNYDLTSSHSLIASDEPYFPSLCLGNIYPFKFWWRKENCSYFLKAMLSTSTFFLMFLITIVFKNTASMNLSAFSCFRPSWWHLKRFCFERRWWCLFFKLCFSYYLSLNSNETEIRIFLEKYEPFLYLLIEIFLMLSTCNVATNTYQWLENYQALVNISNGHFFMGKGNTLNYIDILK